MTEDTFKRSKLFSCREADVRGCVEGRPCVIFFIFFTGTNEKTKEYKGALQIFTVFSFPLAPITPLFPTLGPISFLFLLCLQCNFGRGFNKIFELCRFRRGNVAERPLKKSTSSIFTPIYCLSFFAVEALCGRAQKATKNKR